MMFELVIDSHTTSHNLGNDELNEIAKLNITTDGKMSEGRKRPLGFIITDISEYDSFEYNPDIMSITKSDINISEIKQVIRKSIQKEEIEPEKKKDVDMGIVSPSPSM